MAGRIPSKRRSDFTSGCVLLLSGRFPESQQVDVLMLDAGFQWVYWLWEHPSQESNTRTSDFLALKTIISAWSIFFGCFIHGLLMALLRLHLLKELKRQQVLSPRRAVWRRVGCDQCIMSCGLLWICWQEWNLRTSNDLGHHLGNVFFVPGANLLIFAC